MIDEKRIKNYDIFDLTKIILSLMIVGIHTKLFPMILYPWLRLAVPLFFIISAFLLYSKINNNMENKKEIIKNYIFRLLKLYLLWFVALLPITIYVRRNWFDNGILEGILSVILKPFIASTFIASWYISATIIGTLIVDGLSKILDYKVLCFAFTIIYLFCCLMSAYSFLIENNSFFNNLFFEPQCSFLVSLIYILLGKLFAENKIIFSRKKRLFLLFLFLFLLYVEWLCIFKWSGIYYNDCYVLIMPASLIIFDFIKNIRINLKNPKCLRQFSSFIYPYHASLTLIVNHFSRKLTNNEMIQGIVSFIAVLTICYYSFLIVKRLEKRVKFLKYSY